MPTTYKPSFVTIDRTESGPQDCATEEEVQHPFDAREVADIYLKRFGVPAPHKVVDTMRFWNVPNAERAQVLYDLNLLVRMLLDHLTEKHLAAIREASHASEPAPQPPD